MLVIAWPQIPQHEHLTSAAFFLILEAVFNFGSKTNEGKARTPNVRGFFIFGSYFLEEDQRGQKLIQLL